MPKISIITIVFNDTVHIEETILSVISQTYSNIEYIVIDGNSLDGTVEVIKKYCDNISFWISEKDNGIYDAMNKGLTVATGEYVLFLNSGDVLANKETLSSIPFSERGDIFYGETLIKNEQNEILGLRHKKLPHNLNWKHMKNGMVVCHQSIIVRRTLAPAFNLDYNLSADVDWVIRCLKKAKHIVFSGTIISVFLAGGVSRKRYKESLRERFQIMIDHFGLFTTLCSHFLFFIDSVLVKFGIIKMYRSNNI